ncbi:hypothetical protein STRDD10_01043 [Streptococcus sp. DD10]|nr:hypothetical protein STRDD10_01043 [Streptococcus sp. DD10]
MRKKKYLIIYFLTVILGSLFGGWKYVEPPMPNMNYLKDE